MALKRIFKPGNFKLRTARSKIGRGLYAEEVIPKGACIIEYVGRSATAAQIKANTGKYLFWTSDTTMIDGNIAGNTARFINHSCRPNCEIDLKAKRIFYFAKRTIKPGEELTFHYGPEYLMMFDGGKCLCPKCAPEMH